jgi:hypothetical protein
MKRLSVIFVTLIVFGLMGVSESQAGRIERRDSRQHDRIEKDREMRNDHLSRRERIRLERRQYVANRHIDRMRHNDTNRCDRGYYDDDLSFRESSVVIPILLPPLPPLPLVFPGMHIRIFSSR